MRHHNQSGKFLQVGHRLGQGDMPPVATGSQAAGRLGDLLQLLRESPRSCRKAHCLCHNLLDTQSREPLLPPCPATAVFIRRVWTGSLAESGQLPLALAPALITKGASEKIHGCQELGRVTEKLFCILQWIIHITIHLPQTQNFYNPKGLPYVRYGLWLKMVFCVDSQTVRCGGKVDCG